MERKEVYDLIDGERFYQDNLPHHSEERDEGTPIAAWIIYMEQHLAEAKENIYDQDDDGALESIRKVTALGVACMEYNETKPRS